MPSQATVTVEATLDADELTFLKEAFKRSKRGDERITVVHLVKCLEEMDYIIEGDTRDFIRSVVPKAFEADALGLQDAIKVATSAKTQEGAEEEPQIAVLGRDDSLAQLENSFQTQMQSGEIPETVAEGEPPLSPILNRDESLAQLERSFARQLISGDIPEVIVEKEEDAQNGSAVGHAPVVHVDVPRRRSLPGGPSRSWKGMTQRSDTLSVLQQKYPAGQEGPNPEVVDLPHRRSTISVPYIGEGSLVGLDGPLDDQGDSDTSPPTTPELFKQTSEEALLETASDTLGVAPVEISNVPKRRKSLPVSKSWSEAAAKERNYFAESEVSYDTVERSGPWWKCVVCAAPTDLNEGNGRGHPSEIQHFDSGRENGEDYAAAVESIKPEMWIKSSGATSSTRSIRPDSSDVCSVM